MVLQHSGRADVLLSDCNLVYRDSCEAGRQKGKRAVGPAPSATLVWTGYASNLPHRAAVLCAGM